MLHFKRIAKKDVDPQGQLAEQVRRDKDLAMRFGIRKLFSAIPHQRAILDLANPRLDTHPQHSTYVTYIHY